MIATSSGEAVSTTRSSPSFANLEPGEHLAPGYDSIQVK